MYWVRAGLLNYRATDQLRAMDILVPDSTERIKSFIYIIFVIIKIFMEHFIVFSYACELLHTHTALPQCVENLSCIILVYGAKSSSAN